MTMLKKGDWWLRILSLVLAIVIYYSLKDESVPSATRNNDRTFFQHR